MKTVLVPMNEAGGLDSMLACARIVAGRFGAHVEGFYQRRSLPDITPSSLIACSSRSFSSSSAVSP